MSTITFPNRANAQFFDDIKKNLNAYFESRGLSEKADGRMVRKTIAMLAITFIPYGLILSNRFSPWEMLGLVVIVGIGMAGIGFSVAHDAQHGAYSSKPWVNRTLGLWFDMMGANGYMWRVTHNVIHHTYTNIHGVDEDLVVSPLLRLSPHAEYKGFQKFQHWYAFFAYAFSTLFWAFVKDYKYFFQRDLGPYKNIKHPAGEWVLLFVLKAVYYAYTIVIPWLVLDVTWWQFVIGQLVMHFTAGFILGIVFQLAHVVEDTVQPLPDHSGNIEHSWAIHEMETTSDFARTNKFLNWYIGGLNFQIEHHLFPKVCSIHYPALSSMVEDLAKKHGIRFNQHPTMWDAVKSHYRMLKRLGNPECTEAHASQTA